LDKANIYDAKVLECVNFVKQFTTKS